MFCNTIEMLLRTTNLVISKDGALTDEKRKEIWRFQGFSRFKKHIHI